MDLNYSEQERLLKTAVHDLLEAEVDQATILATHQTNQMAEKVWSAIASGGWFGMGIEESRGGHGGSLVDLAIVLEEMGFASAPVPVAEQLAAAYYLSQLSGDAVDRWLPDVLSGRAVVSFAVVTPKEGKLQLKSDSVDGEAVLVPYGDHAALYIVSTDDGYALVERDQPGVTVQVMPSFSRTQQARVTFDNARAVLVDNVESRTPRRDAREIYNLARDSMMVGMFLRVLNMTVAYAGDRVQFGRPIGSFQAVQYRCDDIALSAYGAQALLYQAVWMVHKELPAEFEIAACHSFVRHAGDIVTRNAHQVHGGIGVTQEYPLHIFTRRIKAGMHFMGSASDHRELAALSMGRGEPSLAAV